MNRPNIWWVASFPKSGNTWTRAFITAYFGGKVSLDGLTGVQDVGTYWAKSLAYDKPENLSIMEQTALRPAVLLHMRSAWVDDTRMWVKTHCAAESVAGFEFVPRGLCAGAVYVIRDPRSIVSSWASHMDVSLDEAIECITHPDYSLLREGFYQWTGSWAQNVRSWLESVDALNAKVFFYEDFLLEPREAFSDLVRHVGNEEPDPKRLADAIQQCSFDRLAREESESGFSERPEHAERFFRRGSTDWTQELTSAQARRVENAFGELMSEVGYL